MYRNGHSIGYGNPLRFDDATGQDDLTFLESRLDDMLREAAA